MKLAPPLALLMTVVLGGCAASDQEGSEPEETVATASAPLAYNTLAYIKTSNLKCVEVGGWRTDDTAPILQYTCTYNPNQQWTFRPYGDGTFDIVNKNSQKCIDVPNSATWPGAKLQQWGCNGSYAQRWKVIEASNYRKFFVNMNSGNTSNALDVPSNSATVPLQLQQWSLNYSPAQTFYIQN